MQAQPAAAEPARSFLMRIQEDAAAPIIKHCAENVPELKTFLEAEYAAFRDKFRVANAAVLEAGVDSAELAKPVTPEAVAEFQKVQEQMLAQVKKLDPKTFCAQLRTNLANQTVDSIRIALQAALTQYTNQEAAKGP
jgi:restriction endonuclease Mrr